MSNHCNCCSTDVEWVREHLNWDPVIKTHEKDVSELDWEEEARLCMDIWKMDSRDIDVGTLAGLLEEAHTPDIATLTALRLARVHHLSREDAERVVRCLDPDIWGPEAPDIGGPLSNGSGCFLAGHNGWWVGWSDSGTIVKVYNSDAEVSNLDDPDLQNVNWEEDCVLIPREEGDAG